MDLTRWEFVCAPDRTWTWQFGKGAPSGPFSDLATAKANATSHGFDPFSHRWASTDDGRTTYYYPGKTPVNLPAGMEPPEK